MTQVLCSDCDRLVMTLEDPSPPKRKENSYWKTLPELWKSYRSCQLCNFIASTRGRYVDEWDPETPARPLKEYEKLFTDWPDIGFSTVGKKPIPIEMHKLLDTRSRTGRVCEVRMVCFLNGRWIHISIAVWIEACLDPSEVESDYFVNVEDSTEGMIGRFPCWITTKAPILKDESPRTFKVFLDWVEECSYNHEECRVPEENISDEDDCSTIGTVLPTRILDVGSSDDLIKLVETQGARAPYVALSHCWGPEERRPLRTTTFTLKAHLQGIPWTKLPKTFQDAIRITRELHIRYIWIDSLCIIQDNEADWLREAGNMGDIYSNAGLTIAAASALDSTQGCFVTERGSSTPLRIFHKMEGSEGERRFKLWFAELPVKNDSPKSTPLARRAWVCQEWYLSRRMIFCTKGGFGWKCKSTEQNERGIHYDMGIENRDRGTGWEWMLEHYSECQITYQKDRLIALQGIANVRQRSREGEYCFGIWTDDLPRLLIWMAREIVDMENPNPIRAPSWSWASRPGSKMFLTIEAQFFLRAKSLTENETRIDANGKLKIRAPMQTIRTCRFPATDSDLQRCFVYDDTYSPESALVLTRRAGPAGTIGIDGAPIHYIQYTNGPTWPDENAIGLAFFDEQFDLVPFTYKRFDKAPKGVVAMALMASQRLELDPLWIKDATRESTTDTIYGRGTPPKTFETGPQVRCDLPARKPGNDPLPYDGHGATYYWVLLLVPIEEVPGQYRRVGMGVVGCPGWLERCQAQEITIL